MKTNFKPTKEMVNAADALLVCQAHLKDLKDLVDTVNKTGARIEYYESSAIDAAGNNLLVAENDLMDVMSPVTGIPFDKICSYESRQKVVDFSLRLLVPHVRKTKKCKPCV